METLSTEVKFLYFFVKRSIVMMLSFFIVSSPFPGLSYCLRLTISFSLPYFFLTFAPDDLEKETSVLKLTMKEEDGAMEHSFLHDKKILIVDDEPELLKMVEAILKDEGFARLVSATSQKEGIEVAKAEKPDLAILDVMLPDGDGFSLMESIRTWSDMPVIFLTARDEAMDKLAGLGLGADDYITKPFMPPEFLLRVNAVLRRCYKEDVDVLKLDGCVVDFGRAEVRKEEKILPLTAMEYRLLKTLAKNAGRIVTMDAVCEALWGDNPFGYENSLNAHIRRVREKIEKNPSTPVSLVTIKGLGYRLIVRK